MTLNVATYVPGQNPAPMATLTIYNPNAVAVVVTGVQLQAKVLGDPNINRLAMPPSVVPIGPGMTTSVPALGTITIGPFPVVVASAANGNTAQSMGPTGSTTPVNPQGSQPLQYTLMIGADVYGSDGSYNQAGVAALLVSYLSAPPLGFQGGFLQFNAPNNFIGMTPGWP
jgi:hypothetical protein